MAPLRTTPTIPSTLLSAWPVRTSVGLATTQTIQHHLTFTQPSICLGAGSSIVNLLASTISSRRTLPGTSLRDNRDHLLPSRRLDHSTRTDRHRLPLSRRATAPFALLPQAPQRFLRSSIVTWELNCTRRASFSNLPTTFDWRPVEGFPKLCSGMGLPAATVGACARTNQR